MRDKEPTTNHTFKIVFISVVVLIVSIALILLFLVIVRKSANLRASQNGEISPITFEQTKRKRLQNKFSDLKVKSPKIFVAISSYRDPELCSTLEDLFNKSLFPKRLSVGVVQQNDLQDSKHCFAENSIYIDRIRIISMDYKKAKGPTFARSLCEGLLKDEEYVLMTDSHMRFEPAWDCELLDMIFRCRRPRRSVITMYPDSYERIENDGSLSYVIENRRENKVERLTEFNEDGILTFESPGGGFRLIPKRPQFVPMFSGCFMFGSSDIIKLIPFHPNTPFLFFGEEQFMTFRLLSHGFDLVGPRFGVVYHLWKRDYRKTFWDNDCLELKTSSIKLIKDIMSGNIIDEKHGMGNVRSLSEIEDYLGIHLEKQVFTRKTNPWRAPKAFRLINDEFVQ